VNLNVNLNVNGRFAEPFTFACTFTFT